MILKIFRNEHVAHASKYIMLSKQDISTCREREILSFFSEFTMTWANTVWSAHVRVQLVNLGAWCRYLCQSILEYAQPVTCQRHMDILQPSVPTQHSQSENKFNRRCWFNPLSDVWCGFHSVSLTGLIIPCGCNPLYDYYYIDYEERVL